MMKKRESASYKITGGVYLVADPAMDRGKLMESLHKSLEGGVDVLQIWNHWPKNVSLREKEELADEIVNLAEDFKVPVLINEEWKLLKTTRLHGVHFDELPADIDRIKNELDMSFIFGITCSNNLKIIKWANCHQADYISFCSMFPSPSAGSCEIVRPETVQKARTRTTLPLFVSGGVTPNNLGGLKSLGIDGVAVISGILSSDKPGEAAADYMKALQNG